MIENHYHKTKEEMDICMGCAIADLEFLVRFKMFQYIGNDIK